MKKDATRFDRIIRKIKDNRILAYILVLGTLVIVLSQFTDATSKLINFFSGKPATIKFAGIWRTEMLKNPWFVNKHYKYIFEFKTRGDTLDGVMKIEYPNGYQETKSIWDVKIKDDFIFLYTQEMIFTFRGFPTVRERVDYKVFFKGTLTGNIINLVVTPDRPDFEPWEFAAVRETN
jgi:hypothetical protein